jgi:hypothetical protein
VVGWVWCVRGGVCPTCRRLWRFTVERSLNLRGEHVATKGRKRADQGRTIPIPEDLADRLRDHLATEPPRLDGSLSLRLPADQSATPTGGNGFGADRGGFRRRCSSSRPSAHVRDATLHRGPLESGQGTALPRALRSESHSRDLDAHRRRGSPGSVADGSSASGRGFRRSAPNGRMLEPGAALRVG